MEEQIKELEILKETIEYMEKARNCMKDCDNITNTEYLVIGFYIDDLQNRALKLENEVSSYKIEGV